MLFLYITGVLLDRQESQYSETAWMFDCMIVY